MLTWHIAHTRALCGSLRCARAAEKSKKMTGRRFFETRGEAAAGDEAEEEEEEEEELEDDEDEDDDEEEWDPNGCAKTALASFSAAYA